MPGMNKLLLGKRVQIQLQVSVPATGRVVVNADAVKARLLTPGDERREVGQGPADWNSERDADPGHPTRPSLGHQGDTTCINPSSSSQASRSTGWIEQRTPRVRLPLGTARPPGQGVRLL